MIEIETLAPVKGAHRPVCDMRLELDAKKRRRALWHLRRPMLSQAWRALKRVRMFDLTVFSPRAWLRALAWRRSEVEWAGYKRGLEAGRADAKAEYKRGFDVGRVEGRREAASTVSEAAK